MASDSYSVTSYLLDRANIQDTLANMYHLVDQSRFDELATKVFAPEMVVDYTSMFGGEPQKVAGEDQAEQWKNILTQLAATQHVITGIVPELPEPSAEEAPTKAKVTANVFASMKGDGGKLVQNGGHGSYEMVRTKSRDRNPWRIAYMKANIIWYSRDLDVMSKFGIKG